MSLSRIAIKLLTASDLSFFRAHLHRSKQKGINLNSDVFVRVFYPGLRGTSEEFSFPLVFIGPGGQRPFSLTRKVWRTEGSKNWRLDGELVNDPVDEPGRFDALREGDLGVIAFEGTTSPSSATLVLISSSQDAGLHAALIRHVSTGPSMAVVGTSELTTAIESTTGDYDGAHPLMSLLVPDTVEAAVYGSQSQQQATLSNGLGVPVSPFVVREQMRVAGETGHLGEEAFGRWLTSAGHSEDQFTWVARSHARAAFDFQVKGARWAVPPGDYTIDVKTTRGPFGTPIHMSWAEIRWAAGHPTHRVARICAFGSEQPEVVIVGGIHEFAKTLLDQVAPALPQGCSIDSFEIDPSRFTEEHRSPLPLDGDD